MNRLHRLDRLVILALIAGVVSACGAAATTPTVIVVVPGGTEQTATSTATALPPPSATATASAPPMTPTPSFDASSLSAEVKAILDFFPLAPGAVWSYQATVDQSSGPQTVNHWKGTITATVTGATVENGFPIYRVQWAGHPDITSPDAGLQFYVVRETGIYKATSNTYALEIARANAVVDPAYMAWPLKDGKIWGDPVMMGRADGRYVWIITDVGSISVPSGTISKCYKAVMYTNPDTTFESFCPGKGLARYEYHHHGSVDDEVWGLASFEAGR